MARLAPRLRIYLSRNAAHMVFSAAFAFVCRIFFGLLKQIGKIQEIDELKL